MELFSITCTTCRARLKVRDAAAIGQILGCPKCGSMVQVLAPEGWRPPDEAPAASTSLEAAGASSGELPGSGRWKDEVAPAGGKRAASELAGASAASFGPGRTVPEPASRTTAPWRDPVAESALAGTGGWGVMNWGFMKWTPMNWILWAGLPTMAVCAALGAWLWSSSSRRPESELLASAANSEPAHPPTPAIASEPASTEPASYILDRRWVPSKAQGLLSLSLGELNEQPAAQAVLRHLGAIWNQAAGPLYAQFDLRPAQIRRLTWITSDAAQTTPENWLQSGVVIVDLPPGDDENRPAFDEAGTLDWKLAGAAVHPSSSDDWPHPFAIIDERTIVTGPEGLLRELADRTEQKLDNAELERLLDALDFNRPLVAALDLAALRKAKAMPEWLPLVDVWHVAKDDWRDVRDLPGALGLEGRLGDSLGGDSLGGDSLGGDSLGGDSLNIDVRLACPSETTAQQVRDSLDRLLEAMQKTLAGEVDGLTKKLLAGQIKTADAGRLKLLLSSAARALKDRQSGTQGALVWVRTPWKGDLPDLAVAALASVPEFESSHLAAARPIDEENQRQLLAGLLGYEKSEGALPFGAAEASLLSPDTRLSWIATLLPYYDRLDWHGELNFARSWNDAANIRVTRRPLEQAINPALGPSLTKAGFPVTHYVGLAGIGADAGLLELRDPRAGAFGFRRQIAAAEIADGASDTIALMGVQGRLGAWGAGGDATVRPLTQRPYINGPDGFGSGQPDGMFVGMADGSVRFLSQDIDPSVLEALATIQGGEKLDMAAGRNPLVVQSAPNDEMPLDTSAQPGEGTDVPRSRRSAKPEIDLTARLNDPIPAIQFEETPLADVVQFLSGLSTAPIMLDPEALAEVGIRADKKVSLHLTDTTVGKVLTAVLKEQRLAYTIVDGQVLVTNPQRREQNLETLRLGIGDLVSGEQSARQLANLVERFVEPASWEASGGSGGIEVSGGELTLRQTHPVAQQAIVFLDKLRLARGKTAVGEAGVRPRSLETRYDSAKAVLDTSVTANFRRPARLEEITEYLHPVVKARFLFDGPALSAAGVSPDTLAPLTIAGQPLAEALRSLLDPLHLSYRIVDAKTILITSADAANERLEVEFYRADELVGGEPTGEALVERIKGALAPRSWDDAGGAGLLEYDPSGCLIVLQTQPRQIELERLLADWRAKAKTGQ